MIHGSEKGYSCDENTRSSCVRQVVHRNWQKLTRVLPAESLLTVADAVTLTRSDAEMPVTGTSSTST